MTFLCVCILCVNMCYICNFCVYALLFNYEKMKKYKMTKKYANFNYLIVSREILKNKIIKNHVLCYFYYCFQSTKRQN